MEEKMTISVSEKLKNIRKFLNLRQNELADEICFEPSHISKIENGLEMESKNALKRMNLCISAIWPKINKEYLTSDVPMLYPEEQKLKQTVRPVEVDGGIEQEVREQAVEQELTALAEVMSIDEIVNLIKQQIGDQFRRRELEYEHQMLEFLKWESERV